MLGSVGAEAWVGSQLDLPSAWIQTARALGKCTTAPKGSALQADSPVQSKARSGPVSDISLGKLLLQLQAQGPRGLGVTPRGRQHLVEVAGRQQATGGRTASSCSPRQQADTLRLDHEIGVIQEGSGRKAAARLSAETPKPPQRRASGQGRGTA